MSVLSKLSSLDLQVHRPVLARTLPFALFILCMAVEGMVRDHLPEFFDASEPWWYPLRVVVTGLALAYFWSDWRLLLDRCRPLGWRGVALSVMAGSLVIAFWIGFGPLFRVGTPLGNNPLPTDPQVALVWLLFRFLGTATLVPLIEELFWRSYLMRRIDDTDFGGLAPGKVSWTAMLVSSAAFALEHKEVLAGFVAGMAFAALYRRRGDLREAILAHAVANALLFAYVVNFSAFHFWG